ncbi:MAG TPA: nuclear transport factor 2 family protein [Actinomycetota bacterium]|nr:nuclear transport factor 2 family protein [Actinomycetota bacterium]
MPGRGTEGTEFGEASGQQGAGTRIDPVGVADARVARGFEESLEEHLAAIRARDLERLRATLSTARLTLVTATGDVLTGADRFLDLHRDWFASDTWTIDTGVVSTHVGTDLAVCIMSLRYRDRPGEEDSIDERSILTLALESADDRWLVVFDQNTPCRRT